MNQQLIKKTTRLIINNIADRWVRLITVSRLIPTRIYL